jgi:site-specific recombinase XerD
MLRHATGPMLAGDGHDIRSIQDYQGHKNIQSVVVLKFSVKCAHFHH